MPLFCRDPPSVDELAKVKVALSFLFLITALSMSRPVLLKIDRAGIVDRARIEEIGVRSRSEGGAGGDGGGAALTRHRASAPRKGAPAGDGEIPRPGEPRIIIEFEILR